MDKLLESMNATRGLHEDDELGYDVAEVDGEIVPVDGLDVTGEADLVDLVVTKCPVCAGYVVLNTTGEGEGLQAKYVCPICKEEVESDLLGKVVSLEDEGVIDDGEPTLKDEVDDMSDVWDDPFFESARVPRIETSRLLQKFFHENFKNVKKVQLRECKLSHGRLLLSVLAEDKSGQTRTVSMRSRNKLSKDNKRKVYEMSFPKAVTEGRTAPIMLSVVVEGKVIKPVSMRYNFKFTEGNKQYKVRGSHMLRG